MRRFYQRSMAQGIIYIGEEERLSAGKNRLDSAASDSIFGSRALSLRLVNPIRSIASVELISLSQAPTHQSLEKVRTHEIKADSRKAI